jgi:Holliday junction resolvase RusA-like endonuclease
MRVECPDRPPDLEFRVLGHSAPGGSKDVGVIYRNGPNGTKVPVTDEQGKIKTFVRDKGGVAGKDWRSAVASAGHEAMAGRAPFDGPLFVELTIIRPRGPGHYGQGRNAGRLLPSAPAFPAVAPDVTKLTRSTEDALNTIVWKDDSRNVALLTEKVYADQGEPEGAIIKVWALPAKLGQAAPPVDQLALSA